MGDIEKLENRVTKLEKHGIGKILVQYVLSPVLIIAVGTMLNYKVDKNKEELQRLEIAEGMITGMFNDESPYKTFATLRIMKNVLDELLYEEIKEIIENFYANKSKTIAETDEILAAAEQVGGEDVNEVARGIMSDSSIFVELAQFRKAKVLEEEAIDDLLKGNIDGAIAKLDSTSKISAEFEQSPVLAKFIEENRDSLEDPLRREKVYQQILKNPNYNLQKNSLGNLKKRTANRK
ncbi:MAG: hypothetical protein COB85_02310 [Bacteroidetes bacterium]|nr:MAG: hypothetical protein COB85_02310 [Bacteroidota bacterium]